MQNYLLHYFKDFKIKRKEKSYETFILNFLSKINSEELFFRVINKRIVSPV